MKNQQTDNLKNWLDSMGYIGSFDKDEVEKNMLGLVSISFRNKTPAEIIKAARIFGTDIIRVWCGNKNPEEYTRDEKSIFLEQCIPLAQIAEKEDVRLCMECHNNSFVSKKESALSLMKTVSSPKFRMYWQQPLRQHRKLS